MDNSRSSSSATLNECLREAIALATGPTHQFAYTRCLYCEATWYGERPGRENPEKPRHRSDCVILKWEAALQSAERAVLADTLKNNDGTPKDSVDTKALASSTRYRQVGWAQIESRVRQPSGDVYYVVGSVSDEKTPHHQEPIYVASATRRASEEQNMDAHFLMLELCHQLGSSDGQNMVDTLFAAVKDTLRYRWLTRNVTWFDPKQHIAPALGHVSERIFYHASGHKVGTLEEAIDAEMRRADSAIRDK